MTMHIITLLSIPKRKYDGLLKLWYNIYNLFMNTCEAAGVRSGALSLFIKSMFLPILDET